MGVQPFRRSVSQVSRTVRLDGLGRHADTRAAHFLVVARATVWAYSVGFGACNTDAGRYMAPDGLSKGDGLGQNRSPTGKT